MSLLLLVEDEPLVRRIMRDWLLSDGYEVEDLSSAEEALPWFSTAPRLPDAVLLDVKLPGMNGFQLADKLAQEHGFRRIIFITAFFWEEETRRQLVAREMPYFEKPLKFKDQVLPFLRRYVGGLEGE